MSSFGSTTAATPASSSPIRYEAQPRSSWVIWRKIMRLLRRAEADVGEHAVDPAREPPGHAPSRRSSTGTSSSRTRDASSRTATPRITPISLGGSGPERAKVKNTATITAAAAKITRPECATPPTIASLGVVRAVPVLLGRAEQEHGVVHRDREDHREEEHRAPGVEEALRLEAEQRSQVPVLEDQLGDAERGAGGEQVGDHAERGDQRRLQRDEQQQEAEARARRRSPAASSAPAAARGRGSRRPRRRRARRRAGRRAAGRSCAPTALLGRVLASGRPGSGRARPSRPARASRARCPGRGRATAATRAAWPGGATSCSGAGGAGAEGGLHLRRSPGASRSPLGHDLDRRHAGVAGRGPGCASATSSDDGDARRRRAACARGARPRPRSAASGARRSAPRAARACRRGGRAWPARPAAA